MTRHALTVAFVLLGAWNARAQADVAAIQATKRLEAVRVVRPPVIDGRLDEPEWALAPAGTDFIQQYPDEGAAATDASEFRVLYDNDAVYIGGTFFDREPERLVVNDLKRDFDPRQSDVVGVILRTFSDFSSFSFAVNPGGAQRDTQNSDDGRLINTNWDGVWFAKTRRFDGGWTWEVLIPFKTLRFPATPEQSWGVNVFRMARRKNEASFWSPQPRNVMVWRPSYTGRLTGVRDVQPGRNLQIKPFATGTFSNKALSNLNRQGDGDGGVDLKYGVSSSLTFDFSYRTDFSQVEADEQQINLTRFSLFYPEKREFFLENQGAFRIGDQGSFGVPRRDLLPFFSRRIGLSASGEPIPILAGARLTGRQGPYNIGFMNMQTERFGGQAADNFTAVRVNRNVVGSSIGAFYFGREASGASGFNRVAGADINLNYRRVVDLDGLIMRTDTQGQPHGSAARAAFNLATVPYTAHLSYTNISRDFQNDLGFTPRTDVGLTVWDGARHFQSQRARHILQTLSFGASGQRFDDSHHEQLVSAQYRTYVQQAFAGGGQVHIDAEWNYERLKNPFQVSRGVFIPPGEYRFRQLLPTFASNPSRAVSVNAGYTSGEFYSGAVRGYSGGIRWRMNAHLAASASYRFNDVDLPQGQFNTDLAFLRLDCSFTTSMFLNTFVQYNSAARNWLTNVRYRFMYRPLSDFYIVYNDSRTAGGTPQRTVALKHTLLLSF